MLYKALGLSTLYGKLLKKRVYRAGLEQMIEWAR